MPEAVKHLPSIYQHLLRKIQRSVAIRCFFTALRHSEMKKGWQQQKIASSETLAAQTGWLSGAMSDDRTAIQLS